MALTKEQIEKYANMKGVKKIAVENALSSLTGNAMNDSINLGMDAKLYKWNEDTVNAIKAGIQENSNK